MTYKIKYNYRTGDSFGSRTKTDILEYEWENKENARIALKWIQEHYKFYEAATASPFSFEAKENKKVIKESRTKDWFYINERYPKDDVYPRHRLKLRMDNGSLISFSAPWCGYFESLHSAEIVEDNEEDKFETGHW